MEPNDEAKDIPLPLRGKTVSRCIVDSALGIDFIEGGERSTIRIESHFLLRFRRFIAAGSNQGLAWGLVAAASEVAVAFGSGSAKALTPSRGIIIAP